MEREGAAWFVTSEKHAESEELQSAVAAAQGAGQALEVRIASSGCDLAELARRAAAAGVSRLVVAGGDGTLNQAAAAVYELEAENRPLLGLVPYGTGNDFARSHGLPLDDPASALQMALGAAPRAIDVGWVNERLFVNVASAGFGAQVTESTPQPLKDRLGGAAYALNGLAQALRMQTYRARLTGEGFEEPLEFVLANVGNARYAGGGFEVAPRAVTDDGLLDLVVVGAFGLADLPTLASELATLGDEPGRVVAYWQLPAFTLEPEGDLPLNVDGEPCAASRYAFRVERRALSVALPEAVAP